MKSSVEAFAEQLRRRASAAKDCRPRNKKSTKAAAEDFAALLGDKPAKRQGRSRKPAAAELAAVLRWLADGVETAGVSHASVLAVVQGHAV